jgi:hypothetical protein
VPEVRAVGTFAGLPPRVLIRIEPLAPCRVVPEPQSFFVFVVRARDKSRHPAALRAVAFRAISAFVRIIRSFLNLLHCERTAWLSFLLYVRRGRAAQAKIDGPENFETKFPDREAVRFGGLAAPPGLL